MTKQELKEYAASIGLNLFGVAAADRFAGVPANVSPASILPEVRSVLVVGAGIPRGAYRGIEEGTLWNFADKYVGRRQLVDLARRIEQDTGYEAVPVAANLAGSAPGKPVAAGRPLHNVRINLEFAAVAAGLGEIGFCGLLLTPDFGPRNMLGVVLTELELEPDPIFTGKICDGAACGKCAAICPSHAINPDKTVTVDICGRQTVLADINYNLCRTCPNGAAPDFITKIGQEELMYDFAGNQPKIVETSTALTRQNVPNINTAVCNRTCIAHLEEAGKLNVHYAYPFRQSEPWLLKNWER